MEEESNSQNLNILDSKYIIKEKKGHGATADVYCVEEIESKKAYAAKVLKKESKYYQKEIDMLNIVSTMNCPYLVNLVSSGSGPIVKHGRETPSRQYLILEYAEKGELFDYIYLPKKGLGEKFGKVVFAKILRGIDVCHRMGVCHRDLKMENILLDGKFNPKIADFGFATLIQGSDGSNLLRTPLGTLAYAAPEILLRKGYNGIKADIFSLGVVLLTLVTCKIGFLEATRKDPYYRLIMTKRYKQYWDTVGEQIKGVSTEFKNLFTRMISFTPETRPSIQEILMTDPWLEEIRVLNEEQLQSLEAEIIQDFQEREQIVKAKRAEEAESSGDNDGSGGDGYRGLNDEKVYYSLDLKPKMARKTGLDMENFMKIKGEFNPVKFMNKLLNKIGEENGDNCFIEPSKKKLQFNLTFLPEEKEEKEEEQIPEDIAEELKKLGLDEEEGEEDNEDEEEKENNSIIKVKMLESPNGGYILRFDKLSGDREKFYQNLDKVKNVVNQSL